MKKVFFCLSFILLVFAACDQQVNLTYTNPVWDGYLTDPHVFKASNSYYYAI